MKSNDIRHIGGSCEQLALRRVASLESVQNGSLAIDSNLQLTVRNNATWSPIADLSADLYAFTQHTFTSGNTTGPNAPTASALNTAYAGAPFLGDTKLFDVQAGKQIWTVPKTGLYNLVSIGAARKGKPARVALHGIALTKGDKLSIIVGQIASDDAGGCGATTVVSQKLGLLCVAAGTGGFNGSSTPAVSTANGTVSTSGSYSGDGNVYAGGGAGYNADGRVPPGSITSGTTRASHSYTSGSVGGSVGKYTFNGLFSSITGGFGGGGGGAWHQYGDTYTFACGGGGGYSGGNASYASAGNYQRPNVAASGGNCFVKAVANTTSAITSWEVAANSNGSVTIAAV